MCLAEANQAKSRRRNGAKRQAKKARKLEGSLGDNSVENMKIHNKHIKVLAWQFIPYIVVAENLGRISSVRPHK